MEQEKNPNDLPEFDPESGCQVIAPPDDLRKKAVTPNKGFSNERNAINRAERALEELSVHFGDWMNDEVALLTELRDQLKSEGMSEELLSEMLLRAHDLRGQAATLGFPSAATLCGALCNLIEAVPDKSRIPPIIIDHYVDSVRAIVRENVTNPDNLTAIALIKKLKSVTEEFVAYEIKNAQEESTGVA